MGSPISERKGLVWVRPCLDQSKLCGRVRVDRKCLKNVKNMYAVTQCPSMWITVFQLFVINFVDYINLYYNIGNRLPPSVCVFHCRIVYINSEFTRRLYSHEYCSETPSDGEKKIIQKLRESFPKAADIHVHDVSGNTQQHQVIFFGQFDFTHLLTVSPTLLNKSSSHIVLKKVLGGKTSV